MLRFINLIFASANAYIMYLIGLNLMKSATVSAPYRDAKALSFTLFTVTFLESCQSESAAVDFLVGDIPTALLLHILLLHGRRFAVFRPPHVLVPHLQPRMARLAVRCHLSSLSSD